MTGTQPLQLRHRPTIPMRCADATRFRRSYGPYAEWSVATLPGVPLPAELRARLHDPDFWRAYFFFEASAEGPGARLTYRREPIPLD